MLASGTHGVPTAARTAARLDRIPVVTGRFSHEMIVPLPPGQARLQRVHDQGSSPAICSVRRPPIRLRSRGFGVPDPEAASLAVAVG